MTTLVLSPRFSDDSIALWRAAHAAGWRTRRLTRIGEAVELAGELTGEPVALYGETLMADALRASLRLTLLEPAHDFLPRLPERHRRRAVSLQTLAELRALRGPLFAKPVDDKWFPAGVFADAVDIDPQIEGDLPVLVAEPVRFGLEVRAFVVEREVATLSAYIRGGQLARGDAWALTPAEEDAARTCLRALLADPEVDLPPAVVVDVGEIVGRGWAVVEANPAWASGICGTEPAAVLGVLRRACVRTAEASAEDLRFARR